jgi:N-acetylglucosamine-6-phosphate deacetylase
MSRLALSGRTLLLDGNLHEATVLVEGSVIVRVTPGLDPAADIATTGYIAPGFIDLQINGAYGCDFSTDGRTVAEVAARLPETGVTSFLPTIITSPFEAYQKLLREVREASQGTAGAQPLGVHLEGPYLNPLRKGAHDPALLRAIDVDEIVRWADDSVRIVTLAPELPGALDAIKALRGKGIVVSAGHSNATFAEAMAGVEAGITWGTHLFNAMSGMGHREPGLPGALLSSCVLCGLIADGTHVHPPMVKLAYRAKGAEGITLITDAMAAMARCVPPGRYRLSDREVIVDGATARLTDGTLAGSILTMEQAVQNVVKFTGCSVAEALMMASATPARVLDGQWPVHKSRIAPDCDADLVVLDDELRVTHTVVAGKVVYEP